MSEAIKFRAAAHLENEKKGRPMLQLDEAVIDELLNDDCLHGK